MRVGDGVVIVGDRGSSETSRVGLFVKDNDADRVLVGSTDACDVGVSDGFVTVLVIVSKSESVWDLLCVASSVTVSETV